ncbi:MAG TPA: DUF4271 domain-containing protein [Flavisolibacter sp.]|nr:DUF4271 domain-containing protein [Flavisolibacter sp.]
MLPTFNYKIDICRRMNKCILIFVLLVIGNCALGQTDSYVVTPPDTTVHVIAIKPAPKKHRIKRDSTLLHLQRLDTSVKKSVYTLPSFSFFDTHSDSFLFTQHPYFSFTNPIHYSITVKQWQGKELIFYTLIGLLIFFSLIKNGSSRYMMDLFQTFFRTSPRQRQLRDQLVQSPLPSLLLNIFFLLSAGMFLALLLQYFRLGIQFNFWLLFLYCFLGLIAIYAVKYISLKFFGWIFQISSIVDTYIFIVFSTNKVIGIFLLPFLVILSFTDGLFNQVAITLGITMVCILYVYRYFLSYVSVQHQLKISFFHFALYFTAFEIAPLLLINKLLFRILAETP